MVAPPGPASRGGSAKKTALLLALYFAQGLPFGFQAQALPVYLRAAGISLTAIGFASALSLPWMLKPLWAPFVDRWGRRKQWIVPMQLGLALTCAAAALVPPDRGLGVLLALVFLMNLFAATQDIAVDGLAVDLLRPEELGLGNAAQVVGYKIGMLTAGGLLVAWSATIGWRGLFGVMALLVVVVLTAVLLYPEPPPSGERARERSFWEIVTALLTALRVPGQLWLLLFVATYKLGESMIDVMFKPFLVDLGFTPARIGLWIGTYGMVASLAGSLAGGWLATRAPLLAAVSLTAFLRVLPLVGEWMLAAGVLPIGASSVVGVAIAEHFFGGALTTAMFAFMMSRVDRRVGASHFTLLAGVEVLGKMPAGPLAGVVADRTTYGTVFLIGVVLSLAFLALLLPLRRLK